MAVLHRSLRGLRGLIDSALRHRGQQPQAHVLRQLHGGNEQGDPAAADRRDSVLQHLDDDGPPILLMDGMGTLSYHAMQKQKTILRSALTPGNGDADDAHEDRDDDS